MVELSKVEDSAVFWNAENASVQIGNTTMDYVSFGHGPKNLVLIPGLGDGLATVKGKALLLAKPYKCFFDSYTVYMFSRKNEMPDGYSIRDMASDQAEALKILGIGKTSVMGVSEGGMIAQYLALDFPDLVEKLVIAVSAPSVNPMIRENVERWMGFAREGNHKNLMTDTAEKSYSGAYLKKIRKIYPIMGLIGKPRNYRRFMINAAAILEFDVSGRLDEIKCPTLIIGGSDDRIVGIDASYELHAGIRNSSLFVYGNLGHAAYEEAGDFNGRVLSFLKKEQ